MLRIVTDGDERLERLCRFMGRDDYERVYDLDPYGSVLIDTSKIWDLSGIMCSALRDDEYARMMLVTDHVSEEWCEGALYVLGFLGLACDGGIRVNPRDVLDEKVAKGIRDYENGLGR